MLRVSVVVPLYNEEDNVARLYQELRETFKDAAFEGEFIFIDDGSKDRTVEAMLEAAQGDERVHVVRFRRNFGQTAAMAAGIDLATGDVIATLDGDLQNVPADIPMMLEKLEEGYDLVAGWRKFRKDPVLNKKIPSRIANWLISKITKVELHDYGCTLKVIRSEIAKQIQLYGEMHRFIPALAAELGVRIAEVPVRHRARMHGASNYGISRTIRVLLDLLTVKFFLGFSTRPLHMFGGLGMLSSGAGVFALLTLVYQKFVLSQAIGSRPLLLLGAMLLLIGLQFICFGLLAEILVRTYHESQDKKTYRIRDILKPDKPGHQRVVGSA